MVRGMVETSRSRARPCGEGTDAGGGVKSEEREEESQVFVDGVEAAGGIGWGAAEAAA